LKEEVVKIEKEKESILLNYNKIKENKFLNPDDLNKSYSLLTNKRDDFFTKKCKTL
jgi:hypothetical protein